MTPGEQIANAIVAAINSAAVAENYVAGVSLPMSRSSG